MRPSEARARRISQRPRWLVTTAAVGVALLAVAACSSSGGSSAKGTTGSSSDASNGSTSGSAPGVTSKSINIGVVTDKTGATANQGTAFDAAFDAVVASINASGGIYGRKINLITEDDQSTPAGNLSATQSVVQARGAFAVVQLSGVAQASAAYLSQAGVPTFSPGLQALDKAYSNLFTSNGGTDNNPKHQTDALGTAFKFLGANRVGGLTFACAPCAVGVNQGIGSATAAGLQTGYKNLTVPVGVTDWTPYVDKIKSSGTNGDWSILQLADNLGYYSALDQAGIKMVKVSVDLFGNQYLKGATLAPMQGVYVEAWYEPAQISTPATKAEATILKTYGHQSQLPDWNATNGYEVGELLKTALTTAGPNPTRAGLISKLRAVSNWTGAGLAAVPVSFSKQLTNPTQPGYGPGNCVWLLKVVGNQFQPVRSTPFCGPTTTTG